jgi:hypothetical protein
MGGTIHVTLLLQLLMLLVVANGAAVAAKKVLGTTFARPLDGGTLFVDGRPVLGPTKTIRGIITSVLATSICASLMDLGWEIGALIAAFAMAGDLLSSFVKRRLRLASSSMAIGLDHIPESLFPLLAGRLLLPLSIFDVVVGVTIFVAGGLVLSPILFRLNLRDEPH